MRFSPEFIDKVRESNNLAEIIGQYTELKGSGSRLMGRCPFPDHGDKSPSFSVSEDNQLYFCYGCKKGGNVFTFLETFNGMTFPEGVEFLARRASIPLPEKDASGAKRSGLSRDQKDLFLKINKTAAVFFHQQLKQTPEDHPVREYLKKRGLTDETVEKFRLGVAFDEWQGLVNHFKSRKVPMDLSEALGLVKPKKNARPEDSHFDLFRDRLMFPIFSSTADVIGFGGRTLQADGLPKYLNSSDSPVFNKSRVLYGIHETGKFIRAQDSAVVVEGYMDAIALYTAGIKNVVAILGTAFTPDHAKVLKRYTRNVVMLLDGDEAGLNGAERSLPILLEAGLMPKGFALPDKMDPDDFVKARGVEQLRQEIERAPELFSLLLTRRWMLGYHGSPSEKVRIMDEASVPLLRVNSQNRGLQELYMLEIAQQLDVEMTWIRKILNQASSLTPRPGQAPPVGLRSETPQSAHLNEALASAKVERELEPEEEVRKIQLKDAPRDEAFVLSLLIHYENLMQELVDAGPEELLTMISHQGIARALALAIEKFRLRPGAFDEIASSLASEVDHPAAILGSMAQLTGDEPEGFERKLMTDYLNSIRQKALKAQAKVLLGTLKANTDPKELEKKLKEFMELQRNRLDIGAEPGEA